MEEKDRKPIIYKTKDFNKIVLEFLFPFKKEEKYTVYKALLLRMLQHKINRFPTEETFSNALIKNYVLDFSLTYARLSNNEDCFKYTVVLPDREVLQDSEYHFKDTLSFVIDAIYNPYHKKQCFYESELEIAKTKLKTSLQNTLKKVEGYASIRLEDLIDDAGYFKDSLYKHQEEIDLVNNNALYAFYEEVIGKKRPIIFGIGNISKEMENEIIATFPDYPTVGVTKEYIENYSIPKKVKGVCEEGDYNQTILKYAYKIKDFQKEDIPMLSLVHFLLSSQSSSILQEFLRTQKNLVYVVSSGCYFLHGVFIITASIKRQNKEDTRKVIEEVMKKMGDASFIEQYLENVKLRKKVNLERQKDSIFSLLSDLEDAYFDCFLTLPEEYEVIKNVCACDIALFIERFFLDTVYCLEGTHEK